ncbi:hypothetical protein N7468_006001 [Penicillium chermesinum]|uniref:Uncharacterized protein n=1 Tax=Penicillium chermesinum TaxID=63820 RepID=A0A9W9P0H9_9EURO|nr:uncharacterized protein N7468_006001 [Penicillium chermesinum]KAJ5233045.1 hypothetical protein N7468_006001 [Penicillium chermesinum]
MISESPTIPHPIQSRFNRNHPNKVISVKPSLAVFALCALPYWYRTSPIRSVRQEPLFAVVLARLTIRARVRAVAGIRQSDAQRDPGMSSHPRSVHRPHFSRGLYSI